MSELVIVVVVMFVVAGLGIMLRRWWIADQQATKEHDQRLRAVFQDKEGNWLRGRDLVAAIKRFGGWGRWSSSEPKRRTPIGNPTSMVPTYVA